MVVLLAVISPMIVGYAWPVSVDSETIYNVENTIDVTSDFQNGTVNMYVDNNDLFINNYYLFNGGGSGDRISWAVYADRYSDIQTGFPYLYYIDTPVSLTTDSDGLYSLSAAQLKTFFENNAPSYPGMTDAYAMALMDVTSTVDVYVDGFKVRSAFYYYESGILNYITNDYKHLTTHAWSEVSLDFGSSGTYTYRPGFAYKTLSSQYAILGYGMDPSFIDNGIHIDTPRWFNGYSNSVIDVLLSMDKSNTFHLDFETTPSLGMTSSVNVEVRCDSSRNVSLYVHNNWVNQTIQLGNTTDFPYFLLNINTNTGIVTLSGIPQLNGFTDSSYQQMVRKSVTVDTSNTLSPISWMDLYATGGSGLTTYLIPHTVSNMVSADGIVGGNVNFRTMTVNDFQVQIKNALYWPIGAGAGANTVVIRSNAGTYGGTIDAAGNLTFTGNVDTVTVPIQDLYITSIGLTVYLNGQPVIEYPSYQSYIYLDFNGEFILSALYSDLTPGTKTTYDWLPGGFGIGVDGFCVIGLLSSMLSALAAMLYGRRSGTKVGLVLITAISCAAVYMIVLMGGF